MITRALVLGAIAAAFLAGSAQAQTVNLNPIGIDPEHYQCYRPAEPVPVEHSVKLRDQFTRSEVRLVEVAFLCVPVSKNGGLLADEKSHLVCYFEQGGKNANRKVVTINQLGKLQYGVGQAVMLCVPSRKKVLAE